MPNYAEHVHAIYNIRVRISQFAVNTQRTVLVRVEHRHINFINEFVHVCILRYDVDAVDAVDVDDADVDEINANFGANKRPRLMTMVHPLASKMVIPCG